jgi:hypothetical protein
MRDIMKLHSGTHSGTRFHLEKIGIFYKNDIIRRKIEKISGVKIWLYSCDFLEKIMFSNF